MRYPCMSFCTQCRPLKCLCYMVHLVMKQVCWLHYHTQWEPKRQLKLFIFWHCCSHQQSAQMHAIISHWSDFFLQHQKPAATYSLEHTQNVHTKNKTSQQNIEGSGPEWNISGMLHSQDTLFWSGTLNTILTICNVYIIIITTAIIPIINILIIQHTPGRPGSGEELLAAAPSPWRSNQHSMAVEELARYPFIGLVMGDTEAGLEALLRKLPWSSVPAFSLFISSCDSVWGQRKIGISWQSLMRLC